MPQSPLLRLLAEHLVYGLAAAATVGLGLLALDVGGLATLVGGDEAPIVPLALLFGGLAITFGGVAMAVGVIVRLGQD